MTFVTRPDFLLAVKLAFPLYSFWNLDFFRTLIPDICMNVSTLGALALDYAIAVYPIFLITLSYVLIELYDRDVRCLVYIWRPFNKVFGIFKSHWDIRTSVIDSFNTFFLLSYVKVLSVSSDLLMYVHIHSLGSKSSTRLYYDPTLHYFGEKHLPFAILALIFLTLFILFPTLVLALYPFKFFQKFLSILPIRWHFLYAFVDSFQGCYKDGTEPETLDCRLFAQFGLFFRLAFFVIYALNSELHVLCICSNSYYTMVDTSDECKSFQKRHIFLPINRFCVSCAYQSLLHFHSWHRNCKYGRTCVPPCYPCTCNIVPICHHNLCFVHYTPLGVHAEKMWQTVMIFWN